MKLNGLFRPFPGESLGAGAGRDEGLGFCSTFGHTKVERLQMMMKTDHVLIKLVCTLYKPEKAPLNPHYYILLYIYYSTH
jgi:hypothetical protein